ncbi:hypothetical protein [Methylorubrum aminovorans]|uniref:hypothetical protein n=1 Tax=Methylorubrum aminovorans TaxID=269069 RepID=UPI0024E071B0|nr:hypothetical protein [Methylorubrum aminovorans]
MLAQELEATTPFKPESVHSDWYVESEDVPGRMLRVRHVVVKRGRLDPLLAALAEAGIAAGPVTVGTDEARSLPIDLLSGGTIPSGASSGRAGATSRFWRARPCSSSPPSSAFAPIRTRRSAPSTRLLPPRAGPPDRRYRRRFRPVPPRSWAAARRRSAEPGMRSPRRCRIPPRPPICASITTARN